VTASKVVRVISAFVIAGAGGLAAVAYVGAESGEPGRLRYAVSFALPYATVGVVALVGVARATPTLVVAAGWVLIPLSVISIALVPLIIPAVVLVGAGLRLNGHGSRWSVEIPAALVVVLGIIASLVALLVLKETVEWRTPTSRHRGEQTTWAGSLLSWGLLAVVLFAATIRDGRNRVRGGPARRHRSPSDRRG
jgi:hypothetical protein